MNSLSDTEVAWLAGIYEGEGYCGIRYPGRNFSVQITMSDFDIIERFHELVGIGTVREIKPRGKETYKVCKQWVVSSIDAVHFLETITPWLGIRRKERAIEAIDNWRNNRTQTSKGDTTCIHGHDLTLPNARRVGLQSQQGVCRVCANEASRRHNERNREKRNAAALKAYHERKTRQ
jgi:hypothetical protein